MSNTSTIQTGEDDGESQDFQAVCLRSHFIWLTKRSNYVLHVDGMDGEVYSGFDAANSASLHAFLNGAEKVEIRRMADKAKGGSVGAAARFIV